MGKLCLCDKLYCFDDCFDFHFSTSYFILSALRLNTTVPLINLTYVPRTFVYIKISCKTEPFCLNDPSQETTKSNTALIAGVTVTGGVLVLVLSAMTIIYIRKRKAAASNTLSQQQQQPEQMTSISIDDNHDMDFDCGEENKRVKRGIISSLFTSMKTRVRPTTEAMEPSVEAKVTEMLHEGVTDSVGTQPVEMAADSNSLVQRFSFSHSNGGGSSGGSSAVSGGGGARSFGVSEDELTDLVGHNPTQQLDDEIKSQHLPGTLVEDTSELTLTGNVALCGSKRLIEAANYAPWAKNNMVVRKVEPSKHSGASLSSGISTNSDNGDTDCITGEHPGQPSNQPGDPVGETHILHGMVVSSLPLRSPLPPLNGDSIRSSLAARPPLQR